MKKLLLLALCVLLVFAASACGAGGTGNNGEDSPVTEPITYPTRPQAFAASLKMELGAEYRLYVDKQLNVLSVEFADENAKQTYSEITFSGKALQTVAEQMIVAAQKHGFIKQGDTATFSLHGLKSTTAKVKDAASAALQAANATFEVEWKDSLSSLA